MDNDYPDGGSEPVDMIGDVAAFHLKFGQGYEGKPRILPQDLFDFRSRFHWEEIEEYDVEQVSLVNQALRDRGHRDGEIIIQSLENQLDALVDGTFVILGTAYLQFGKDRFREAWRRVVAANMAKVRADSGIDGCVDSGRDAKHDIVKPPGWRAPDHRDLVIDYEDPPQPELCQDEGCPRSNVPHICHAKV